MSQFAELTCAQWGYVSPHPAKQPLEIAEQLAREVRDGIKRHEILSIDRQTADDNPGFERVYANLALSGELFDLLLNGPCGYRARYFVSEQTGEAYNRLLVETIAPILIENKQLYTAGVTEELCRRSLYGRHTKFWFSKEVTSPSYEPHLATLTEVIHVDRWRSFWRGKPRPHKGLLAPIPDDPCVLLNGTFLRPSDWCDWEQKPDRSHQIWAKGWT
jgi:hypothetical protein